MYYTWLPEAFICCLTWQAWYLLIAMRHHLQPSPPSFSSSVHFQGMCQGETMRAWVLGLYKLLSWMDIYLGGHSKSIDMCGDGFLQDKERDGGRRLEKRESRYRQRKISSVNQAWLTARYFWDWWQFSTGGTPASHLHYNVKLPPPPLSVVTYMLSSVNSYTRQPDLNYGSGHIRPNLSLLLDWCMHDLLS